MSELEFVQAGPDSPGYLKRERRRLEFLAAYDELEKEDALGRFDMLVEYLAEFVVGTEKDAAQRLLEDASKAQIDELTERFVYGRVAEVPDPESEGSEAG